MTTLQISPEEADAWVELRQLHLNRVRAYTRTHPEEVLAYYADKFAHL